MMKTLFSIGLLAGYIAAAPTPTTDNEAGDRRELFPLFSLGIKCAHSGCSARDRAAARSAADNSVKPMMSLGDANAVKGPVKTLEMLALNDDLNTVIRSDSMCTRRRAMARAAGLAAGLTLAAVNKPGFAAEAKMVKMGSDNGQLVYVPDEVTICKGDSVTWINNKGGPHNVVFDDEASPEGVNLEALSQEDYVDEGKSFTRKFDKEGSYAYYCQPHRGAGMNGNIIVE